MATQITVRGSDGGIVGEAAVDFIRQFKVDYAVIGASGIDEDGTVLDFDYREVRVAREIIRHARQTILVSDIMKFDRTPPVKIADLDEIDVLVTDAPPPSGIRDLCKEHGVRLEVATSDADQAPASERVA